MQDYFIDKIYNTLKNNLRTTKEQMKHHELYEIKNELVFHKANKSYSTPRLLIPLNLREHLLEFHHNNTIAAHMGRDKMIEIMCKRYYWPSMHDDIRTWVSSCLACAKKKPAQPRNDCKLIPIRSTYPFEIFGIDICGPFNKTKDGNRYILICVDLFTYWVEATPLKTTEAEEVADKFLKLIIC